MGVSLSGERIRLTLGQADTTARRLGDVLVNTESGERWASLINRLRFESVPKTYVAVLAVTLTARAMYEPDALCVRDIKANVSGRGYSAPSIGSALAAFAKTHGIDLRARSSQPLNNQPFTFKDRILRNPDDMIVANQHHEAWRTFNQAIDHVESTTSEDAALGLAVLFHLCRREAHGGSDSARFAAPEVVRELDRLEQNIRVFVEEHPDGGSTGQAFTAAILDLLYGSDNVRLGHINDPDAASVGDVHVGTDEDMWLWAEVKQRVITTGDVAEFADRVAAEGGGRAIYCAFANAPYPDHVSRRRIEEASMATGVRFEYFDSTEAFMARFFGVAPGSPRERMERLLLSLDFRLKAADCPDATQASFRQLLHDSGVQVIEHPPSQ